MKSIEFSTQKSELSIQKPEFILTICSTGQVLRREETNLSALQWFNYWKTRLLRYQRTPQEVKDAFALGPSGTPDVIVGWSNSRLFAPDEVPEILSRFDSYHRKYWPG